jgi:hypothetical protein
MRRLPVCSAVISDELSDALRHHGRRGHTSESVAPESAIRPDISPDFYIKNRFPAYCYDWPPGTSDVGQMDMYLRIFDDLKRGDGDNPTVFSTLPTAPTAAIYPFPAVAKPAAKHMQCLN